MTILLDIQVFVTYALVGLIWTVQLVHYPAFHYIEKSRFVEFERMHTGKIVWVVAPLMIVELLVCIALIVLGDTSMQQISLSIIVISVWLSTFLLSVPLHKKLSHGKDRIAIERLIKTNWIRTILWSIKGAIVLVL